MLLTPLVPEHILLNGTTAAFHLQQAWQLHMVHGSETEDCLQASKHTITSLSGHIKLTNHRSLDCYLKEHLPRTESLQKRKHQLSYHIFYA